jgi:hypothetical protein
VSKPGLPVSSAPRGSPTPERWCARKAPWASWSCASPPSAPQALAVPGKVQTDLLEAAAIVPRDAKRIDDSTAVERLRVRLVGASSFPQDDLQGAGQAVTGDVFDIATPDSAPRFPGSRSAPLPAPGALHRERCAGDPRRNHRALAGAAGDARARAERLVRYVNALIEKKPTMSLPSALEVLRTRVGDCNEHATLYVAHGSGRGSAGAHRHRSRAPARRLLLPRVGRGLPRDEGRAGSGCPWTRPSTNSPGRDPLAPGRGGLEHQAAILGLVGKAQMTMLDLELRPGSTPVLVGRATAAAQPFEIALPAMMRAAAAAGPPPSR